METTSIVGKIGHIIYKDEKTRYTVARFRLYELNEKMITITGYLPQFQDDCLLNLTGTYLDHPRFGMQFQVQHYHRVLPTEPESIITFLSSPLFPGIGKKFAESIVDRWGEDSLVILKENPSLLKEIKGYTPKKEEALVNGLVNYGEDEEAIRFFTTHGLGIRNILRLERAYGKDAYQLVKENPYRLIDEVDGIGFKIADKLALNMGFDWDDPRRLMAGLCAMTMEECMRTGDSYVEYERLAQVFANQFNDNSLDFDQLLKDAVQSQKLFQVNEKIFHPSQYKSEQYIAHTLKEYPYLDLQPISDEEVMVHLELLEKELNITYDESQKEAILTFFHSPFTIMTGGPGTGKSTVIGAMIHLWKRLYPSYSLACAAPTGRASKRLFELNGVESFTIHSLLKWDLESNTFGMDETNPLSIDCLIVDEFSMVDTWLMSHLLKASQQVKKILIVGDKDQLPSVAPGQVLKDLIDCQVFPVISLTHIYRQKEGSDVISLAHQIREKELDFDVLKNDIKWFECRAVDVKQIVLEVVAQAQLKGYPLQQIQVLQ